MCKGGGIFSFLVATDAAPAQAKVNKARVAARDARNERAGSESELQRFNQALTNKKILDRAGKNYGILAENLGRRTDAYTLSTTMGQLAVSEELGAVTAAAAAAGVGGSSVEQYNATINTAASLQREQASRSFRTDTYNAREQMGAVITDAVDSFDNNIYRANRDFTYYGPTKGPSQLGNLVTLGLAVGASVAGAPQVGEAILNMKTANMQANYGDSAGATKSFQSGLDNIKGGIGEIRDIFRFNQSGPSSSSIVADRVRSGFSGASGQFGSTGVNFNSISFR